jgi:signal transduction histidine kinase
VVAFGLLVAAGIIRELTARERIAVAAANAERRRVARDLHDGLAQDLALIVAHGSTIADELGDDHPVTTAARRALARSRDAITELSDPAQSTTQEALAAVAHELSDQFQIDVVVQGDVHSEPPPYARENLARIAREAIANAARHGGAENVIVSLAETEDGTVLRIRDDGCGIGGADSASVSEGFGVRSMRERAAAVGGQLNVRRLKTRGTDVEVVVP